MLGRRPAGLSARQQEHGAGLRARGIERSIVAGCGSKLAASGAASLQHAPEHTSVCQASGAHGLQHLHFRICFSRLAEACLYLPAPHCPGQVSAKQAEAQAYRSSALRTALEAPVAAAAAGVEQLSLI